MNSTIHAIVVEDEPQIRRFIAQALSDEGCLVSEAESASQALDQLASGADLMVLDLGLPDSDGLEVIRNTRVWSAIPILVLSARSDEQDKIVALDAGADDYLTKPFGTGELLARIRALLRRRIRPATPPSQIVFGDVEVDLPRRHVSRGGVTVHLTATEFRLLAELIGSGGRVLTHGHLMQRVWGPEYAQSTHYLRIYMNRLRQKLEADPAQPVHLLTETGVGYRFEG